MPSAFVISISSNSSQYLTFCFVIQALLAASRIVTMIYSLSDSVNKLFYANYSVFADHVIGTYSTSDYPIEILPNNFLYVGE